MSNVPLPRPGPLGLIQYAGVEMLQYAAAVSAAARDCRLCRNFYVPHETCIEDAPCTNGDHYEPLPPVRLWRTA